MLSIWFILDLMEGLCSAPHLHMTVTMPTSADLSRQDLSLHCSTSDAKPLSCPTFAYNMTMTASDLLQLESSATQVQ